MAWKNWRFLITMFLLAGTFSYAAGTVGQQIEEGGRISTGFYDSMTISITNLVSYFQVALDLVLKAPLSILVLIILIIMFKFLVFDAFFTFFPGVVNNVLSVIVAVLVFPLLAQYVVAPLLNALGV